MGLRNRAIHAMLANPHIAPFQLLDRPCQVQDWTLIDHLMVIYKVKECDYIEGDPQASIMKMAKTLACHYISESAGSRCVVLVKDGARAQKPAVREARVNHPCAPHIEFCKLNLCAIEYTIFKFLADMGMKNKLFLVTGAKEATSDGELPEGASVDNLVSLHRRYLEYLEFQDECVFVNTIEERTTTPESAMPEIDPSYADGTIDRPEGLQGVFVATFADPETAQVSILRDACLRYSSREADTLLVKLANLLKGSVTVCSGDSDLVAVLTACGREGITMRLDNKSYHGARDMHMSSFGDLLVDIPENRTDRLTFRELASSDDRFRALCDIGAEDEYLLPITRRHHDTFELMLDAHGKANFKEDVAMYLYQGGIRGSLYTAFLSRFFATNVQTKLDSLGRAVKKACSSTHRFRYIFEKLCPASEGLLLGSELDYPQCTGEKRKMSCLEEHDVPEPDPADRTESQKSELIGLKRLGNAYMNGMVPRGSYGRFLKLNRAGQHFFMRIKEDVIRDETVRMEKLFFMALCGTDYNIVPTGLGIKRLLTGVITNYRLFSSWCREWESLLWGGGAVPRGNKYYNMGMRLASLTKIPKGIQARCWTEVKCGAMAMTMKYACEVWNLKRPKLGAEYGFSERDGVVCFDHDDALLVDTGTAM